MAWVVCVFLVQALPSLRWRSTNNDPRFFCWFHCMLGECPVCKKRDNEMSEKFSINDLYAQYWHCRDFEISHLWQRSIFLGTFLALKSDNLRKKDPAKTYFNKIYRCDNTMNFKQFVVSLFLIPLGQIFIAIHNRYFN